MKFVAKKSACCVMAGQICHEYESENLDKMAIYVLSAYAFGNDSSDRRDDDYACLYDSLADFENSKDDIDMGSFAGRIKYSELPKKSKLLYMSGSFGWDLSPIAGPQDVIDELLSTDWGDLTLDYEQ